MEMRYAVPATQLQKPPAFATRNNAEGSISIETGPVTLPSSLVVRTISFDGCGRILAYNPWFAPTPEEIQEEIDIYQDGYIGMVKPRAPMAFMGQTMAMPSSEAMRCAPAFCMKFSSVQVSPDNQ